METYIAYFDILGFKEFIDNNDEDYIVERFNHIFRESQTAVSGEEYIKQGAGFIPDLSKAKVNCMHISDSIIFWTKEATEEEFKNIIDVCYTFYYRTMQLEFPVRGCLVKGKLRFNPYQIQAHKGITFYNSSLYGQGIIDSYLKAEMQDWAGCYIDKSAVDSVSPEIIKALVSENKAIYYPVPLKDGTYISELAIRIVRNSLSEIAFRNAAREIERLFTEHMNGKPLNENVKRKMNSTIKFLEYFKNPTMIG